jgi:acyl dehydratase
MGAPIGVPPNTTAKRSAMTRPRITGSAESCIMLLVVLVNVKAADGIEKAHRTYIVDEKIVMENALVVTWANRQHAVQTASGCELAKIRYLAAAWIGKRNSRRDMLQETSIGGSMNEEMYFEDFYPGQKFNSLRNYRVTAREIISFGESYDPQPFHIDEGAGENSFFSGLCASGWLTAAIVMRLRVESIKVKGGMIGAGVDEMRWTHPVRPDDKLRTESEVLEVRRSVNRPGFGIVRSRTTVFNQHNVTVMKSIVNWLAPLKNA